MLTLDSCYLGNRSHTLQIPYNKGITWPDLVVGVIGAILISAGLIPPYFELWKRDGRVIGFSKLGSYISTIVYYGLD